ncbi:MAG: TrkH family potassium uptake protein [Rhodospirillales bacterium]|nr:TrkH family potassium uptake protein [Alphaproteobacteria bacterium]MCB1721342.1 TrkH family potassium uptake protein [Alphaproteobacteria bacterium]MCB9981413.1 TrkH family potassium uptake protein [Rhodospirillales bacterium]
MKLQIVWYTLGVLVAVVGLAEMVPAIVDWRLGHENARDFFLNGILCLFFGGSLILSHRVRDRQVNARQMFLMALSGWLVVSVFCAMPLYMSDLGLSFVEALFEAVSGVTTTGATVLSNLDEVSRGVLLWRSMMQWAGGLGIIAFAVVLLPYLKVGGMQLFRSESSGHSDKVVARSTQFLEGLLKVYIAMTLVCAGVYYLLGMSGFDAFNHAMTTLSTGGFSTHDASFGYFEDPALQYAAVFFMILGALPFVLYLRLIYQRRVLFFRDEQVRMLMLCLCLAVFFLTLWLWAVTSYTLEVSFRMIVFSVSSIMSTTGYTVADYTLWGGFTTLAFLLMMYVGGCAGSTAGGMKVMRMVISAKVVARQFRTLLYPNGVFVLNYQGRRLDSYTVLTVLGFLSLYVGANVLMTVALALTGLDFETSMSAAAAALANVGPGIGEQIGPAGNYADLSDMAKWILCAGMIAGRLEILTILVLFSPSYWRA